MRSPYASEREIWVQKIGNAYRRNSETNGALQGYLYQRYHHETFSEISFANWWALSFRDTRVPSVIVRLVCSLRRDEIESRFLRPLLHASLPWFCVPTTSLCVIYTYMCGNATTAWFTFSLVHLQDRCLRTCAACIRHRHLAIIRGDCHTFVVAALCLWSRRHRHYFFHVLNKKERIPLSMIPTNIIHFTDGFAHLATRPWGLRFLFLRMRFYFYGWKRHHSDLVSV